VDRPWRWKARINVANAASVGGAGTHLTIGRPPPVFWWGRFGRAGNGAAGWGPDAGPAWSVQADGSRPAGWGGAGRGQAGRGTEQAGGLGDWGT
jgi:hypothetical protein